MGMVVVKSVGDCRLISADSHLTERLGPFPKANQATASQ
jgi:hypothetical protein